MDALNSRDLELFVITNGRGTFDYVMRSIAEQTIQLKVTVIRDMKWVDALNECLKRCSADYFLRIDDDMILHKYAVAYYLSKVSRMRRKGRGLYICRLWEDWSSKPVNGLRMYSTEVARKIGFRASELGKVDKIFHKELTNRKIRQIKDESIIGLHALANEQDQIKYRNLWRDKNASISADDFANTFDNKIHSSSDNIDKQYVILNKIRKLNSKYKTNYLNFILEQRERESLGG